MKGFGLPNLRGNGGATAGSRARHLTPVGRGYTTGSDSTATKGRSTVGAIKDDTWNKGKVSRFLRLDADMPARMCDVCGCWPAPWRNGPRGRLCSLCYPVVTGRKVQ